MLDIASGLRLLLSFHVQSASTPRNTRLSYFHILARLCSHTHARTPHPLIRQTTQCYVRERFHKESMKSRGQNSFTAEANSGMYAVLELLSSPSPHQLPSMLGNALTRSHPFGCFHIPSEKAVVQPSAVDEHHNLEGYGLLRSRLYAVRRRFHDPFRRHHASPIIVMGHAAQSSSDLPRLTHPPLVHLVLAAVRVTATAVATIFNINVAIAISIPVRVTVGYAGAVIAEIVGVERPRSSVQLSFVQRSCRCAPSHTTRTLGGSSRARFPM